MSGDRVFPFPTALCMVFLFLSAISSTGRLLAQGIEPAFSPWVMIESEPRGAEVYRGDSLLGRTPLRVPNAGADGLLLFYPARNVWGAQARRLDQPLPGERDGVAFVRFEARLRLRSVPHGAAVYRGDSLLGYTPLDVQRDGGTLSLKVPGYDAATVNPGEVEEEAVIVNLTATEAVPMMDDWRGDIATPSLRVAVPAGLALVAGVASVMLKQHADGLYEEYLRKPDGALLSDVKKYDIYAGVSLAIVQVGLGYLVYLLFAGH